VSAKWLSICPDAAHPVCWRDYPAFVVALKNCLAILLRQDQKRVLSAFIAPGALVHTDGTPAFHVFGEGGRTHVATVTGGKRPQREHDAPFFNVNTLISNLSTVLKATYKLFSPKHLPVAFAISACAATSSKPCTAPLPKKASTGASPTISSTRARRRHRSSAGSWTRACMTSRSTVGPAAGLAVGGSKL
jgi:hypothetical protein